MHDHLHGRPGTHSSPAADPVRALGVALLTTGVLLVIQIAGGLVSGSLALLADAAHLLADVGGLVLSYAAARLAQRPATSRKSYGFYRLEVVAAVLNGGLLLGLSIFIMVEAYRRFRTPTPVQPTLMLGAGLLGLTGNLIALYALRGPRSRSLNLRAASLEVAADALGSAGVVVAALVILMTHFTAVDPILSALLAVAIVPRTLHLLNEGLHILLEGTPPGLECEAIEKEIRSLSGVEGVHDLHVWLLTSGMPILTAHVVVVDSAPCDDLLERISDRLRAAFAIEHATIQIEHTDRAEREHARF